MPPIRMSRAVSRRALLPEDLWSLSGHLRVGLVPDGPAVRALAGRPDILVAWTST